VKTAGGAQEIAANTKVIVIGIDQGKQAQKKETLGIVLETP